MQVSSPFINRVPIYDKLGGWPEELGIYGGGENFINFTLASFGMNIHIMPGQPIWHYAEKRGYSWNFDDNLRNRMIATYMFGGEEMLRTFAKYSKGSDEGKKKILDNVLANESIKKHKVSISQYQTVDLISWWQSWR